jgi:hypothetical protein
LAGYGIYKIGFSTSISLFRQKVDTYQYTNSTESGGSTTANTTIDTSFLNNEPILFIASSYYNAYIATKTRVFTTVSQASNLNAITGPYNNTNSSYWKQIILDTTTIDYIRATPSHLFIYSGSNVSVIGREDYG